MLTVAAATWAFCPRDPWLLRELASATNETGAGWVTFEPIGIMPLVCCTNLKLTGRQRKSPSWGAPRHKQLPWLFYCLFFLRDPPTLMPSRRKMSWREWQSLTVEHRTDCSDHSCWYFTQYCLLGDLTFAIYIIDSPVVGWVGNCDSIITWDVHAFLLAISILLAEWLKLSLVIVGRGYQVSWTLYQSLVGEPLDHKLSISYSCGIQMTYIAAPDFSSCHVWCTRRYNVIHVPHRKISMLFQSLVGFLHSALCWLHGDWWEAKYWFRQLIIKVNWISSCWVFSSAGVRGLCVSSGILHWCEWLGCRTCISQTKICWTAHLCSTPHTQTTNTHRAQYDSNPKGVLRGGLPVYNTMEVPYTAMEHGLCYMGWTLSAFFGKPWQRFLGYSTSWAK